METVKFGLNFHLKESVSCIHQKEKKYKEVGREIL